MRDIDFSAIPSEQVAPERFGGRIAWIGLGAMGLPMARNLVNRGFDVTVYNRTPRDVDLGPARRADTPAGAAEGAKAVHIMVSDGAAVREVLFGRFGAAEALSPGALVVNHSTIGVDETKELALRLADKGVEFIDAPVSGSVQPAQAGQLVILAGGSEAAIRDLTPVFATIGRKLYHLGPVGSGAAMKLLVNAYLGMIIEAAGECMAAADKAGLARERFLEVLADTGMWSLILAAKRPMWTAGSYPASFALKHMAKDFGLAAQYFARLSVPTPAALAAHSAYLQAQAQGRADDDMAAVFEALRAAAGATGEEAGR
jgi:3-hydroxyisobutyrate dehydrogenase-like beta-hydroxyacid dehydrogenase